MSLPPAPPVPAVPPRESLFERIADGVSEGMGKPANILAWLVFVVGWTLLFALGGKTIASGSWLPGWFTSLGFNFPLNLITTVAELFIGFLVAANALRIQRISDTQQATLATQTCRIEEVEANLVAEMRENTDLTKQVHLLTQTIAAQTATLDEIHRHVAALSPEAGTFKPPTT